MSTRDKILEALRAAGGCIQSADGRGITKGIADSLGLGNAAITAYYAPLEADGLIGRHQNGKRLYALFLVGHAPTGPALAPTPRPAAAAPRPAAGRPAASNVVTRTMRCGEQIDAARARTDDPVILRAFDRVEEELAADTDQIADLCRQLIELDQATIGDGQLVRTIPTPGARA